MISKTHRLPRQFKWIALLAMLSAGCSSASSDQWPNLAEGFETWIVSESDAVAPDRDPATAVNPLTPASGISSLGNVPSQKVVVELQTEFDALVTALAGQQETYRAARKIAEDVSAEGSENAARRWLSAQLELSRLSRLVDGFGALGRKLTTAILGAGDPAALEQPISTLLTELRALQAHAREEGAALQEMIDREQILLGSKMPS